MLAKLRIEREVVTQQVRQSKVALAKITDIKDQSRSIYICQKEIEDRMAEIHRLENSLNLKRAEVDQQVVSLSMMILQLNGQNNIAQMDDIFIPEDEMPLARRQRQNLGELCQMIRLLYVIEPVGEINAEIMNIVAQNTRDWPNYQD